MKKLALVLTAVAAFTGSAVAADLPARTYSKAPPPVVAAVNWTGCYVGGGVGYGMFRQENVSYNNFPPAARFPISGQYDTGGGGYLGRIQGGCDYQFGGIGSWNLVIGVFGDHDWSDIHGRYSNGTVTANETLREQWAVGGRIGLLVTPQLLTYFSGGYTEARFNYDAFVFNLPAPFNVATGSGFPGHTYKGWFLGSGLEYSLGWAPGLYLKTEYRFSEFDVGTNASRLLANNVPTGFEVDSKKYVQTVTTSLVYKFNFGGGAVVAKY
jgi:outer membrane immunogenic protein